MSLEATCNVWDFSKAKGAELLVMLVIADCVGDEHGHCTVNPQRIAQRCRLPIEEVEKILRKMVRLGELDPDPNPGYDDCWRMTCIPSPLYA